MIQCITISRLLFQPIGKIKNFNMKHVLLRLLEEWTENLDKNNVVGGVLLDLSKVFDCVPPEVFTFTLYAYGVAESFLCYLHYLLNWKQCARINKINSEFLNIVSGVPQRSIVLSIQLNFLFNDFFTLLKQQMPNFADDNRLIVFANNI